jgi:PadR family transcriptional regulator AphA
MKFEYVILGVLSWRPMTGYELGKYLEVEGRFLKNKVHLSQIYRLLARMVDSGWLSFRTVVNDGRPDAKVYRLTPLGEQTLRDWVASPYVPSTRFQDPEFSVRFRYGGPIDPASVLRLLRTELQTRQDQVATYRTRQRALTGLRPVDGVDPELITRLGDLSHDYGAASVDLWIDWLERTLATLEAELPDQLTDEREDIVR